MSVLGASRRARPFRSTGRGSRPRSRSRSRSGSRTGRRGRPDPGAQLVAQCLLISSPLWILALSSVLGDVTRWSLGPDLVLAAAAAAAWTQPRRGAVLFALAIGLLVDTASGTPFGWVPARLAVLTAIFASLRDAVSAPAVGFGVVYLFAIADRLLEAGALALCQGLALQPFVPRALLIALATAAIGPIAISVGQFLHRQAHGAPK